MSNVTPSNPSVSVDTHRLEDGPAISVSKGGLSVNTGSEHIDVTVANAPVEVQTTVFRPDTSIQVGVSPVKVGAAQVGLRGEAGPAGPQGEQGPPGPPGSGAGTAFLPPPDRLDEATGFFFYGWSDLGDGHYLIRQANRQTAQKADAAGNSSDFDAAWDDRVNLGYAPR